MGKRLTYVLSDCMLLIMWAESGCTKQSLDHRKWEGHVHIALQWDKGYTPAGSRFYFYPEDGSEAIVRDCPKEGFSGTLPEGSYRVIVLNSDAWNIALRNEQQHQTAEIYVLPEEEGLSAVPCICQPGNLLLAGGINEADKLEVPYRDTVSVSASPHSRVKKIRFFFKLEPHGIFRSVFVIELLYVTVQRAHFVNCVHGVFGDAYLSEACRAYQLKEFQAGLSIRRTFKLRVILR